MRWPWLLLVAACTGRDAAPKPDAAPAAAPVEVAPAAVVAPAPLPPPSEAVAPIVAAVAKAEVKHVVIISEDGMRPDALTDQLAPRHRKLMAEGATAKLAETIPQSDTLPSHAAMLSGVGVKAHGLFWNSYHPERGFIHVPTIFSVAHAAGLSTAMIVGKPKLRHIALPGTVDYFERPGYLCKSVSERAAAYFAQKTPDLLFVHFSDPDEFGHKNGWMSAPYIKGVRDSDKCLATVLAAIDASAAASTTLVIVTADHGGHGKHHSGGHADIDRDIPWIARGPGVTPGMILDTPISTVDTAATTLAALGLPALPHMVGASRLTFGQ